MDKKCYTIYRQPGYEQPVKTALYTQITEAGKSECFREILIPTEKVIDGETMRTIEAGKAIPRLKVRFDVGERLKVIDGPFRDLTAAVQEMKPVHSRLRVTAGGFGRPTSVDLDFIEVEAA